MKVSGIAATASITCRFLPALGAEDPPRCFPQPRQGFCTGGTPVPPAVSSVRSNRPARSWPSGASRTWRPTSRPQPRVAPECAPAPSVSAVTARIAVEGPPAGQEDRVSFWYPSAVLHRVLRPQPTIPHASERFIHACRKDTVTRKVGGREYPIGSKVRKTRVKPRTPRKPPQVLRRGENLVTCRLR